MTDFDAYEQSRLKQLIQSRQPNFGLPRDFYHDQSLFRAELKHVWRKGWLFAGHSCQVPNPGDYFLYTIGDDTLIIVRDDGGQVNAFYNVCRHRGSVICEEPTGHVKRFICPYHQWTYGRDGRLLLVRGMQQELDKSQYGLHSAHAREVEGMIWVSLAREPLDFQEAYETIAPVAHPQGLTRAKVAKIMDFDIHANWKLVWENNRECYHCNVNHPQYIKANFDHYNTDDTIPRIAEELDRVSNRLEGKLASQGMTLRDETGMTPFPDPENGIWWAANRTPLVEGYVSETMDGKQVAPLMGDYQDAEVGTVRIRSLPNFWIHASCDHAVSVRLTPVSLDHTAIRMFWLVDQNAVEGRDYNLDSLLPFWLMTAKQDWAICSNQQKGVNSQAYTPGPLSVYKEYNLDSFLRWYIQEMQKAMGNL